MNRQLLCLACLLVGSLFPGPSARAEERGLRRSYDFIVEVGDVPDKGWKILAPQQKTKFVLISPSGDQALMVSVPEKSVRPVDRHMVKSNPDGTTDILAGGVSATRVYPLVVVNGSSAASFTLDGKTFSLKPRPPLLGPHTLTDLVTDRPSFGDGIKTYQPEPSAVTFLKSYSTPTEIEVFFGSWCPVCEAWVPRLLKSLQVANNSKIQCNLIGVSREFSSDQNLARNKGIRGLPTFIIRQNGIEVGRLVGAPEKGTVEAALAEVLRART